MPKRRPPHEEVRESAEAFARTSIASFRNHGHDIHAESEETLARGFSVLCGELQERFPKTRGLPRTPEAAHGVSRVLMVFLFSAYCAGYSDSEDLVKLLHHRRGWRSDA